MEIETVEECEDHFNPRAAVTCENEDGEAVTTGTVEGLVRK